MKFANFVHLHTHSQYSLLDGACKIDPLIELAKKFKMPALAITDHGNLFAAAEFYKKATKAGIKPIIGTEAYVAAGSRFDKRPSDKYPDGGFHLVLLAKNRTGYQNMIRLSSLGFLEGFYHRPRIDKELLRENSEGIIALSACLKGEVNWNLLRGNVDTAVQAARELQEIFGEGNFFLEMQNHGIDKEELLLPMINTIHRQTGIPLVATNDCHYLYREDWEAHDILLALQSHRDYKGLNKDVLNDPNRMRYDMQDLFVKNREEMFSSFKKHHKYIPDKEINQMLDRTVEVAERCQHSLIRKSMIMPKLEIPEITLKGKKDEVLLSKV